jgi:hypothetical protein
MLLVTSDGIWSLTTCDGWLRRKVTVAEPSVYLTRVAPYSGYDRSIVLLAPAKATLPIPVTVSILVAQPSASTNFGEPPKIDYLESI